ncbi:MAG TPA: 50S ribosomal protein L25 [Polyangia bacterium]|nr:50S ribosomal protein L25 [Polyangia bacterium]
MEFVKLQAKFRGTKGKGSARRMRTGGLVPAVIYGPGIATLPIALAPRDLTQALAGPLRVNTVLDVAIEGAPKGAPSGIHAIVHEHQYDPVSRNLLHVDFVVVDPAKPVRVAVPLVTVGRSLGEQAGGVLEQFHRSLPVSCLPELIPERVEIDISKLEMNTSIRAAELSMPEGVTITLPAETPLVSVVALRAEDVVVEAAAVPAEGEVSAPAAEGDKKDAKGDKKDAKKDSGPGKKKD